MRIDRLCENAQIYKKRDLLIWGLLGAFIFITIYGLTPLNVMNDKWLLNGYVEFDATQHYAGWLAYRQSDWTIPLGKIDGFGGTLVTYTDSIPWVAILFKCFSNILPETFQYFGIYIFACLILQAISAGLLISLFSQNKIYTGLGVVLFCYSPIMLERAFRHTALASHWLILFMLYFYFKGRRQKQMDWRSGIIPILAIGIHPYFLPIVFGIMFANLIELFVLNHKTIYRSVICLVGSLLTTVGAGYLIGALGTSSSLGGSGYGFFSMNLNAIINPTSCGNIVWSRFLKVLPQTLGNYDGFNYLGFGVLIGIVISIISLIFNNKEIVPLIKRNIILIILCIGFALFAVSNVVTLNGNILFEYPLPQKILSLAAIFRASSRIFYPVYYLIILAVIVGIYKLPLNNIRILVFLGVTVVQLIDISPALQTKFESFKNENIEKVYNGGGFTGSSLWNDIADKHLKIEMLNNSFDYRLAAFGEKYKLSPDITISSSHYSGGIDLNIIYQNNISAIKSNNMDNQSIYATSDKYILTSLLLANSRVNLYNEAGYYIITAPELELDGTCLNVDDYIKISAYDLTDDNWTNGIFNFEGGTLILFRYSDELFSIINNSEYILSNNDKYHIENYEIADDWIYVRVDKDAINCAAPNNLEFVDKHGFSTINLADKIKVN